MIIKGILIVLSFLASLAWLLRRIWIGRSGGETATQASADQTDQASQGSNPREKIGEDADEITDVMAAEIITTWDLLNPP